MNRVKLWSAAGGLAATLGLAAYAADRAPPGHAAQRVDNFRLASADLQSYELYRMKDAPAIVLLTHQNGCAASDAAAAVLQRLKAQYGSKGVEFLMLDSSTRDDREAILASYQRLGADIPILMDANQLVGESLDVTKAGEAIVVDPKTWQVAYRGALDAKTGSQVLDAMISGGAVKIPAKAATGCPIAFPQRDHAAQFAQISYAKQIAPIIEQKCVACHEKGGIGPMELTSYEKIKGFAPMIREVLRTNRMPPYRADPTVGHFLGDERLSADQIKTLVHWIEAGAPRGQGADPLAGKTFAAADWPLGKPDLVLDIPAYTIPATGIVDYQHPWVKNPLTEGRWLRASTIKVEQRQGVHHILTGYMTEVPKAGEQATEGKWGASVGGYAVGAESEIMPKDVGTYLPAGGAIGFQNHYTPFGKQVVDHSKLGLYFYPEGQVPKMVMHDATVLDTSIVIPAGQERHREVAYLTFPHDALLYSAFPHAHYRGASSQLTIRYPNGTEKLLLALPKYDFNWQRFYDFAQPIKVPAGSKLIATYTYDNSTRNPANPDPKRTVSWGEQSFDEMLYTAIRYRWLDETSTHRVAYDDELRAGQLLGMLDDNIDGKIELAELKGSVGDQLKPSFAKIDANRDGSLEPKELAAAQASGHRRASRGSNGALAKN
jgi:hypothetical protein